MTRHPRDARDPKSLVSAMADVFHRVGDLVRSELELVRAEIAQLRDSAAVALAYWAFSLTLLIVAATVLADLAVVWLTDTLGGWAEAALTVAGMALAAAGLCWRAGRRRFARVRRVPARLAETVGEDVDAVAGR